MDNLVIERNGVDLLVAEGSGRNNRLVMLRPRLEEWIIAAAKSSNVRISNYGLSSIPEKLRSKLNSRDRDVMQGFRMLVQKLLSNSDRVGVLASLLRE